MGLSAYGNDDFEKLVPIIEPDVLQAHASMMFDNMVRPGNPVPELMKKRGLSLVAFSPLERGLLLDKFDPKNPPEFPEGDNRRGKELYANASLEKVHAKLAKVKEKFGASVEDLACVAIQFLLAHEYVCCPIVGFRNLRQVKTDLVAAAKPVSQADAAWLRELFTE